VTEEELNSRIPIIPHAAVTDTDCPGCLVVGLHNGKAEIVCNECGVVMAASLPIDQVESYFRKLFGRT
jgi:hypothetical protein